MSEPYACLNGRQGASERSSPLYTHRLECKGTKKQLGTKGVRQA